MERIGLVGLPNAGKSSLFNALTSGSAIVAPHPFTTTESSVGVAHVPDGRLDRLARMSESKKLIYAGVEVVDIAGLVAGAEQGEGLGNRFLGGIREVDALCFVLRKFVDDRIAGESDPLAALSILELELVLADLASVESHLEKQKKALRTNPGLRPTIEALESARARLEGGTPLYRATLSSQEKDALYSLFLLTNKPCIVVINLGEDDLADADQIVGQVVDVLEGSAVALGVCVQLEAEAAALDPTERLDLLEGLGLGEGALARVARAAFGVIGRSMFFTTGDKESRAWTYRTGAKAPECAGVIHSDLQRGFIRAEVIHWDELLELGSWNAAKSAGKLRVEGKEYVVVDGDVLEIRFNI